MRGEYYSKYISVITTANQKVRNNAVGNSKNTITLNGKVYDINSGTIIDGLSSSSSGRLNKKREVGQALDGFIKSYPTAAKKAPKSLPQSHHVANPARTLHHKTQHSKTLLRSIVKRPAVISVVKSVRSLQEQSKIKDERTKRAKKIPKSRLISRFGNVASQPAVTKRTDTLPVRTQPTTAISHHNVRATTSINPVITSQVDTMLHAAINHAHSHEQPRPKLTSSRHNLTRKLNVSSKIVSITASLAAILLLAGFFGYQNLAKIDTKLALMQSHVRGAVPGYSPPGFALSRTVEYQPGQVALNFHSNSDRRSFQIIQKTSTWDSETLFNSYVINHQPYQSIQDNGRTIYTYGNGNATWVDGGVWYQINGSSSLSNNQILKIALNM